MNFKYLIVFILCSYTALQAQIEEVKVDNNTARIFNNNGKYSGYYINLCSSCKLNGYNSNFIVITENNTARIYDQKGSYTGYYINLCSSCNIKNVSSSNILINEGNTTRYYNFKGTYTGKYTNN